MRSKKDRESQSICATENVPLFVMYIRKELTKEQELKLVKHLTNCEDCKINLAYVKEVLQFKHELAIDEKTLLLRYMADPLWYYSLNTLKKQLLKELKLVSQADSLNKPQSQKKTSALKTNSDATKTSAQNKNWVYQYINLALCATTFVGLASLMILATKTKYPNFLSFSFKSSYLNTTVNTFSSDSKIKDNNLYQQLDSSIDDFLSSQNREHLAKAQSIADEIDTRYQDKYGVDLVKYYQLIPNSAIKQLLINRKKLNELASQATGDNYEQRLDDSQKLEQRFLTFGNLIEAYKAKTLVNKFQALLHKYELSKRSTQEGLMFSKENNYIILEGYFLLWQAKRLSEMASFEESEKVFQQTISIGKKINSDDLIISSDMSLSALYHNNNDNKKSLEIAQSLLLKSEQLKKDRIITLMQFAGLAAANLKYSDLSNFYLKESTRLAKELNSPAFLSRSYMLLSLTLAESKNFEESEQYHLKAVNAANALTDNHSRLSTLYVISAYYGKTQLLERNFFEAKNAYQQTLEIMKELKLENNLQLSQINEGLAIALNGLNNPLEAQQYIAIANRYHKLAESNNEKVNCLLSFIPTFCSIR